jgi:acetoin:2,6-dichlorophenolindophenol oxidoreductase subunit alpha
MKPSDEQCVEMYRRMWRIRLFEETAFERRAHLAGGPGHSSIGMEASIVGSCLALRQDDYMVGTHRSHGHPIGKGARVDRLFAELMGKVTGVNQGKGGSMHMSDFSVGSVGETSIVGSGLPVATGAALGAKLQRSDRVALCFFGDGAAAQGTFHESLNLAAIWHLPVVYVCENNQYAENTPFTAMCAVPNVADRAAAYGMPGLVVDGQDAIKVFDVVSDAVERARASNVPSLIETKTYRYNDHSGGPDRRDATYRAPDEVAVWRARDPLTLLAKHLFAEVGLDVSEVEGLQQEEQVRIEAAWQFAIDSPFPPIEAAFDHLFTNPIAAVSSIGEPGR